jgi:hypothetical protein
MDKEKFTEMAKNTVSSKDQLKESDIIKFHHKDGEGKRILFVGNSITLHGVKRNIGWHNEWGMAASAEDKDYVHVIENEVLSSHPQTAFCICQAAAWERGYVSEADEILPKFEHARLFDADIIIIRLIENCKVGVYDGKKFKTELARLISYLDPSGKAKIIVTTGFWKHPGDSDIIDFCKENGYPCVELGDLGQDDKMKAIGLFEHTGVANHPGDEGMKAIADRILKVLKEYV